VAFSFQVGFTIEAHNFQKTHKGIKGLINSVELGFQYYNPSTVRMLKSAQGESYSKQTLSAVETLQHVAPHVE
jgi:alpha-D-xyloside xylohydrolase